MYWVGMVEGVESCKIAFLWGTSYSLLKVLLLWMYRLAARHRVTDRQTD